MARILYGSRDIEHRMPLREFTETFVVFFFKKKPNCQSEKW